MKIAQCIRMLTSTANDSMKIEMKGIVHNNEKICLSVYVKIH